MRYIGWFKRVLKCIGILLVVLALADLLSVIASHADAVRRERALVAEGLAFGPTTLKHEFLLAAAPHVLQAAIGMYLICGGQWIVRWCIPPQARYCNVCGYRLPEHEAMSACAECGATLNKPAEPS